MAEPKKALIPIKNLISFWEDALSTHRTLMTPTSVTLTEQTVKRLKRLQELIGTTEDIED